MRSAAHLRREEGRQDWLRTRWTRGAGRQDMKWTEAEFLAAYCRLIAEGDRAGCMRLRRMMSRQLDRAPAKERFADEEDEDDEGAGAAVFADPPPRPRNPPVITRLTPQEKARREQLVVSQYGPDELARRKRDSAAANREAYSRTINPQLKATRAAFRFRDVARRRRVLAALRAEKELAAAIGAHHLPDSEPADILYLHDPLGKVITDPAHIKQTLAVRARAVERLRDPNIDEGQRAFLQRILDTPAHALEVKTLQKSRRNRVQMTPRALATKRAWSEKHAVPFHTAVVDLRRGGKHSGHRLYIAPNTTAPTVSLGSAQRATDPRHALAILKGATPTNSAPEPATIG